MGAQILCPRLLITMVACITQSFNTASLDIVFRCIFTKQ